MQDIELTVVLVSEELYEIGKRFPPLEVSVAISALKQTVSYSSHKT